MMVSRIVRNVAIFAVIYFVIVQFYLYPDHGIVNNLIRVLLASAFYAAISYLIHKFILKRK
jgi:hypothetical protein